MSAISISERLTAKQQDSNRRYERSMLWLREPESLNHIGRDGH